jgi:chromosome segregation ATPase
MSEKVFDLENVRKRFEDLDGEISTFLQVVQDVKEIRDSVEALPEKLQHNEAEIENQKKELDNLKSTTDTVLLSLDEQAKGVIFDIERTTERLTGEVKSGICQINNIFQKSSTQLSDEHRERTEVISRQYEEVKTSCEKLHSTVDIHEKSLNTLKNNYMEVSKIFDKLEPSLVEIRKAIFALQKRPNKIEKKIHVIEEDLKVLINEKHSRQRTFKMVVLILLIAGIVFSGITFYLQ